MVVTVPSANESKRNNQRCWWASSATFITATLRCNPALDTDVPPPGGLSKTGTTPTPGPHHCSPCLSCSVETGRSTYVAVDRRAQIPHHMASVNTNTGRHVHEMSTRKYWQTHTSHSLTKCLKTHMHCFVCNPTAHTRTDFDFLNQNTCGV